MQEFEFLVKILLHDLGMYCNFFRYLSNLGPEIPLMYCTPFVPASYCLVLGCVFVTQAHWSPHQRNCGSFFFETGIFSQRNLLPGALRFQKMFSVHFTFTYQQHLLYTSGCLLDYNFRRSFVILNSESSPWASWSFLWASWTSWVLQDKFFEMKHINGLHEFPHIYCPCQYGSPSRASIDLLWLPCGDLSHVRIPGKSDLANFAASKIPTALCWVHLPSARAIPVDLTDQYWLGLAITQHTWSLSATFFLADVAKTLVIWFAFKLQPLL